MEKMKTRKPHTKSRKGCVSCKSRHVKCDETKPACVNCDKYGSKCEYPAAQARIVNDNTSPYARVSTPSSADGLNLNRSSPTLGGQTQDYALNIPQLRLLHHFSTVTASTLTSNIEAQDVCRSHIVKIAFNHPFLLHVILALAALHLSWLNQALSQVYLVQAEKHHDAALAEFRSDVQDIDESNFQAVFCFAFILFPYSCAVLIDPKNGPEYVLDTVLQNLALTRRVPPMVRQFYSSMLDSELGRLVPSDTQGIDFYQVPSDRVLVSLWKFSELTSKLYPPDINEAYELAISTLEVLFSVVKRQSERPSVSLVKLWTHQVTPRFMELLSARQPGALIIFAHYAVLLKTCQHYWFMDGYAGQILQVADALIPEEWRSWLDWPKEQIRGSA
ncbi:uncharacterized protein BDR25DRAFT_77007 [Lindgomyces ingoldianus]|uniref:Uncharacterized protein n=1 Tax=Lindgomyces ingoldianus TaxID=673940 RepID=A0ACB6QGZ0_9PLEO|nr:uncharacterized protein BDR25DRAFT_77007 [Lindgomyces ingoldianus]KAF2466258.1 hypothetical protein BDR25DRAFT_77007 [Lindgomyces ingoldianus]